MCFCSNLICIVRTRFAKFEKRKWLFLIIIIIIIIYLYILCSNVLSFFDITTPASFHLLCISLAEFIF